MKPTSVGVCPNCNSKVTVFSDSCASCGTKIRLSKSFVKLFNIGLFAMLFIKAIGLIYIFKSYGIETVEYLVPYFFILIFLFIIYTLYLFGFKREYEIKSEKT